MIIQKVIATAFLSLVTLGINGQNTAGELWKEMPDSIIPILNRSIRAEAADTAGKHDGREIKNLLGGQIEVREMSEKFMDVKLTDKSGVQLLVLGKADGSNLICMNRYYGKPTLESDISFSTADWKPARAETDSIETAVKDFCSLAQDSLPAPGGEGKNGVMYPVMAYALLSSTDGGEITLYAHAPIIVSEKTENKEDNHIVMQKSLKWDGNTFK